MGATERYGHGAGHPRQAVEAPIGQLNTRPPHAYTHTPCVGVMCVHAGVMRGVCQDCKQQAWQCA